MDHDAIPDHTDGAIPAQAAVLHVAAGHGTHGGDLVGLPDLGVAKDHFPVLGSQHTLHSGFDLVDGIIDHAVHPHIHVLTGGAFTGGGIRPDVEAHDDSVGRGGQRHIGLVDRTHSAVDDPDVDLFVGELLQRGLHSLHAALNISLDDQSQLLALAGLDLVEQVLQRDLLHGCGGLSALLCLALLHQLAGHTLVSHGEEGRTGHGSLRQARDLHGDGGTGLGEAVAPVIQHGADTAHGGAGDDDVALLQSAVLHQQSGHRTPALVQTGLDNGALTGPVGVGLQFLDLCQQSQVFQQVLNTDVLLGGDLAHDGLAAPLLGHQTVFRQLLHDPVGVGIFLINLIDGHDNGNIGGLGVVDGFHGLGHDAVIRSHHQNGDVRHHGAAGTHGGESLMARSIQEGDGLAVDLRLIRADVLGDAAGLAGSHGGVPDGIQQGSLAVVNVAHDHHHGSTGDQILGTVLSGVNELLLDGDNHFLFHLAAKLLGHEGGGIEVDHLAQRGHDAVFHQALDYLCAGLLHAAGQLTHTDLIGDLDLDGGLLSNLKLQLAHLLGLVLTALVGKDLTALTALVVAELLLAALLGHALAPLTAQLFQTLVILGQVHVAALAGIHQLFLRHTGGGLSGGCGLVRLLLEDCLLLRGPLDLLDRLLLRLGLCGLLLSLLGRTLLGLLCRLCGLLRRSGLSLGSLGLRRFHLGGFRLLRLVSINGSDIGNLVVLGQMLKYDGQLMVLQRLHVALGRSGILIQNFCDDLGGHTEVPRHISYSIFFNSQSKHLLHSPTRGLGSFIYENTDSLSAFLLAEGAFALFHRAAVGVWIRPPLGFGAVAFGRAGPALAEGPAGAVILGKGFCRSAVFGGSAGTGLFCALAGHSCAAALLLAGRLTGDVCGSDLFRIGHFLLFGALDAPAQVLFVLGGFTFPLCGTLGL